MKDINTVCGRNTRSFTIKLMVHKAPTVYDLVNTYTTGSSIYDAANMIVKRLLS
jgi:hypothetical protein